MKQEEILKEILAELKKISFMLEKRQKEDTEYVEANEAARIIGLRVVKSGSHRNRLTAAYKRGIIKEAIPGRPYLFRRSELVKLAKAREEGRIVI